MLGSPNEYPDRRHMSTDQSPLPFRPQSGSPGTGNVPPDPGFFNPPQQSFDAAQEQDMNFPFFISRTPSTEMSQNFMHPSSSGVPYSSHSVGSMFANPSELLSMPSAVPYAFPSHCSSLYESNLTANTPYYSSGLPQLQSVNAALSLHCRSSILHCAPSPCESDSSFDEPGSGYSSPSMTPYRNTFTGLPSHPETENYLRHTLEIPPQLPVDLSALPEATDRKQPPITHMIKLAIWGSRDKMLTLRGIYSEIERRYPLLKDLQDKPWQRSIRHNLSLKAIFVRLERPANMPGSGHYWAIDFRNGEGNKRDRKRKDAGSRGSSSRSRSDEEDELSEEADEDGSPSVGRRLCGEQKAVRVPRGQGQYGAIGSSMFPPGSMQTSGMTYNPAIQPSRIEQPSPQPHPPQMSSTPSPGRTDQFQSATYPRGMSLPPNVEQRSFYRTTYDPMMALPDQIPFQNAYMQEQMSMGNSMATVVTPMTPGHQMPTLGGQIPFGHAGTGLRRPAPDEGQDNGRKNRRRTVD